MDTMDMTRLVNMAVDKAMATLKEELEKENQKQKKVSGETSNDPKREAPAAKDMKHGNMKLITVGYEYIGDGCDARVVVPANMSDLHDATNTAYALIYAAADVLHGHMKCSREDMANAMMMAVTDHLIQDTISMLLDTED